MDLLIYALGLALILSCFLDLNAKAPERLFSYELVRVLFLLPLLASVYLYAFFDLHHLSAAPHFFSENLFSLFWLLMAYRLHHAILPETSRWKAFHISFVIAGTAVVGVGIYWLFAPPVVEFVSNNLLFPNYGQLYLFSLFMLVASFFMAWRLEVFWRVLSKLQRWQYKYLVIGFFIVCGCLFWCASYRIFYRRLDGDHFLLLAILLIIAWLMTLYAVMRHRLLNRKLFVSRKVIYSAAAPITFAAYLGLLGLTTLMMRVFGWSLSYFFQWLLIIIGLLSVVTLTFSGKVRSAVKYFISTHFYVNKYEYRDEWLAFSNLLQGTLTERGVTNALRKTLSESLYTRRIMIWLGGTQEGFLPINGDKDFGELSKAVISSDDPLILYFREEPYFYLEMPSNSPAWQHVNSEKKEFFLKSGLVLAVPLTIGGQFVGMIGLGPEYTGGRYGLDDFDLLAALGSQAASAIIAARTAELLAQARETSAWDTLSAFVLHDIKNAATILRLVEENALAHIHKPEFQKDMLASVADALRRMNKVQARLNTLKGAATLSVEPLEFGQFVRDCCSKLSRKIPGLTIDVQCPINLTVETDPEIITQILENLALNALEAGSDGTRVEVKVSNVGPQTVQLEIVDNGPGIPVDLLPDRLFDPFRTTKPNGSGIGLWQVKRLVESLGGNIVAGDFEQGGAKFVVQLPAGRAEYNP